MAKNYEDLTIRDHFMFGKIFLKKENCQLILRALFGREIRVDNTEAEKYLKHYDATKYVRLDLLAEEEDGTVYDAELQHKSKNPERQRELPRRMRYYQGMIDTAILETGKAYSDLPETYVVFICTYDPFEKGLAMYSFDTKCNEIQLDSYNDYGHKVYFNTTGNMESLTPEARNMLEYIQTGKACDETTRILEEEVIDARSKEEWRTEYMLTVAHDRDVFVDGYDSGYDSGYGTGYDSGYGTGYDSASIEGVRKLIETCKEFDISKEDTVSQVVKKYNFEYDKAKENVEKYW